MRRRSKVGGETAKERGRRTATPKRRHTPKHVLGRKSSAAGLEKQVALLTRERDEALARENATGEVLKVISSSPGELTPIFQSLLKNATQICGAGFGNLSLYEDGLFRIVAMHNAPPAYAGARTNTKIRPEPDTALGRLARGGEATQIADLKAEPGYITRNPFFVSAVELGGIRTLLGVPMRKENKLIGAIIIYRQEVRPFADKQIELLQNFAAHAVIAIENTRLLSELRDSLEQQTATADVLRVISSSPGALEPVFNAMLENATRICEASFGIMWLRESDGQMRNAALHGSLPEAFRERWGIGTLVPASPLAPAARAFETGKPVQVFDLKLEPAYIQGIPLAVASVDVASIRSLISVPMIKEGVVIGAMNIFRREVRPFTDKQIELVTNFAAQAVIAIENTRLLSELRQSLEQQTATADVLKVISSSPGALEPVFNAMLENATRICEAKFGHMFRYDGAFHTVATYNTPAPFKEFLIRGPVAANPETILGQIVRDPRTIQIEDASKMEIYTQRHPFAVAGVELGGIRTLLTVPMIKDGVLIGTISIFRQEVRPFTDKQIELVTNFAAQAVIAIENTRLLKELRQRTTDLSKSLEDLRTAQDRLVQTEKLASLGQLTAGIAHEIKNPLNFVNNFSAVSVELIDELKAVLAGVKADDKSRVEMTDLMDTLRDNLDKVVQHGRRADSIVKNMLLHSREGSGEHRPVDINALVEESLNLAYHGARAEKQGFNIALERSFDPGAGAVDLFPQEITRVLLNLISNGFYAATKRKADADGGYEPTLSAATKNLGNSVEITIRDNGAGIPADVKEKMFNPFFTTKPAGEGTGLGLSISHDIIVKQHAGSIAVDTEPGKFTEFKIVLPRAGASLAKSADRR